MSPTSACRAMAQGSGMSQTSVGSGTPNDRNENPAPSDGYPSKTFGAESSPPAVPVQAEAANAATLAGESVDESAGESVATGLPSPLEAGKLSSSSNMPDGPNVAPSAWELEAAQGKPDPRDPAPRDAGG